MKIIKIGIQQKELKNPQRAFDKFSSMVLNAAKREQEIDADSYFGTAKALSDEFINQNKSDILVNNIKKLAEKLTSMNSQDYASILYGVILKVLRDTNPKLVEPMARNALAIAERRHDPVHIMARGNDLAIIYKRTENGSENHLKALYTTKRALKDICTNYEGAQKRYKSGKREMKPLDNYKFMLAEKKYEIAKILINSNPNQAKIELEEANAILSEIGKTDFQNKVQKLLSKIN